MSEHRALLEKEMARLSPSPVTVEGVWRRHARRERNQRVMAGALVLVIFVAVVGWLGVTLVNRAVTPADEPVPPSALETFRSLAGKECAKKQSGLDRLNLISEGRVEYTERIVRDVRRARPIYERFADRLESIPLPPGDQRAADIVSTWRGVAERIDAILLAARNGRASTFEARMAALWEALEHAHVTSVAFGIC